MSRHLITSLSLALLTLATSCQRPAPQQEPQMIIWPDYVSVAQKINYEATAYNGEAILEQARDEGDLVEMMESVPFGTTSDAAVLVNMNRGRLVMCSGSEELVTGRFLYNQLQAPPSLGYESSGGLRTASFLGLGCDNDWRISLSENAPVMVKVESEGGFREFNFDRVPLTQFHLRAMDGATVVAFPGDQRYLDQLDIRQRYGSVSLVASGHFESLPEATIRTARGEIAAKFTGYYDRLEQIDIGTLDGDVALDLTGAWARSCRIRVTGTCGDISLTIPGGLGTSVRVNHRCANISADGMWKTWASKAFINPAYGKTKVYLDILVEASCNNVNIILDPYCCPESTW